MSTLLEAAGIRPGVGFDPARLDPAPDLVVVGNAVRRDNPEAVETERRGLPRLSMPEALARFFLTGRRPLVVAGTHGKTTTTALAAWVLAHAGRDPGFLVGGVPVDLGASFRRGGGERFVVEGDEYNAAYFDRGAKFLHYRAETLILTSVEYDHADLYPSPQALVDAYAKLIAQLPATGLLVACGDSAEVRALAARAPCRVALYGEAEGLDVRFAAPPATGPDGARFTIVEADGARHAVALGIGGTHNATNALAVWTAVRHDGLAPAEIAAAFAAFRGVKRRQELVGEAGGVTVIDDFAHHPTAVGKTLAALAARFAGRRLVACFEPRSLTAGRAFFLDGYRAAFPRAARVFFAPLFHRDRLAADERLDLDELARELDAAGTPATATASVDELERRVLDEARPGDVIVTMSSGSFSGLPQRLAAALAERAAAR
jgi:UDP-N-acetylmuramate: L-alanyl-gamma-D-glutamyl-meso-diaminopimelate ligase